MVLGAEHGEPGMPIPQQSGVTALELWSLECIKQRSLWSIGLSLFRIREQLGRYSEPGAGFGISWSRYPGQCWMVFYDTFSCGF